jgi:hypothetical protein
MCDSQEVQIFSNGAVPSLTEPAPVFDMDAFAAAVDGVAGGGDGAAEALVSCMHDAGRRAHAGACMGPMSPTRTHPLPPFQALLKPMIAGGGASASRALAQLLVPVPKAFAVPTMATTAPTFHVRPLEAKVGSAWAGPGAQARGAHAVVPMQITWTCMGATVPLIPPSSLPFLGA